MDKMTTPANRWLLIGAVSALTIGVSACNKPAATDTANATADAAPAAPATDAGNTMAADNSTATNSMSSSGGGAAPSQ
jgi:hypothetical protein